MQKNKRKEEKVPLSSALYIYDMKQKKTEAENKQKKHILYVYTSTTNASTGWMGGCTGVCMGVWRWLCAQHAIFFRSKRAGCGM